MSQTAAPDCLSHTDTGPSGREQHCHLCWRWALHQPGRCSGVKLLLSWWKVRQIQVPCNIVVVVSWLLTSQQKANCVSGLELQTWWCTLLPHFEVSDQTCCLTRSQYTNPRPTSPSTDPILLGIWQCHHWNTNLAVTGVILWRIMGSDPRSPLQ